MPTPLRLALVLTLLAAAHVPAAVLCRTRSGALVVREACRAKETAFAVASGAQGPPGGPGAQGAAGRWPIQVRDAADRDVGPAVHAEWFLGLNGPTLVGLPTAYVLVQHPALDEPSLLALDVDGDAAGTVYYASADCTGPAVVRVGTLIPVLQLVGDTVFAPGAPGSPAAASTEDMNASSGCIGVTSRGGCCRPFTGPLSGAVAEARALPLADLGFTRPFHAVAP